MKINLDKIKELKIKYRDNYVTVDVLQKMLNVVLEAKTFDTYSKGSINLNYKLSSNTLENLGVIEK